MDNIGVLYISLAPNNVRSRFDGHITGPYIMYHSLEPKVPSTIA